MGKNNIVSFAFDGPNRVGKGTQISRLEKLFLENFIPVITVRGDGSRPAKGKTIGDPRSQRRDEHNSILKSEQSTPLLWEEAANRLAREYKIFKNRVLPGLMNKVKSEIGVLLVDRSLVSRTIIPTQYQLKDLFYGNLVDKKHTINIYDIKPDLIFCLNANKETLFNSII